MARLERITPCLWFDSQAEEAAKFYVSVFKKGKLGKIARYGKEGFEVHGRPAGSVMTVEFELDGQRFLALNGGPHFKFSEAISFIVECATQKELDYYWRKLSEGGEEGPCGWLKDRYGLSWQIVPSVMSRMFDDHETPRAQRVMKAMLKMGKLDIKALQKAYGR